MNYRNSKAFYGITHTHTITHHTQSITYSITHPTLTCTVWFTWRWDEQAVHLHVSE